MLGPESRDICLDLRLVPLSLKEFTHPGTRIAEQRLVDKCDRRRRALDVEQDGADVLQLQAQFDRDRTGM
jgi:hypothetical protein